MRIGVVGLGFMGATHLKAIASIAGAQLTAVMDLDEQRLSGDLSGIQGNLGGPAQRMDFSGIKRYRSVEELVADPEVDAVDVCLPTFLHAPVTIQLLRAGKHVLVEKPMALDGAACDQMVAEAGKQGRVLMVAQVLRFAPAYQALHRYMEDGSVGPVRSAIFRRRCAVPGWGPWELDSSKSGGGIFDLLIHDVDMCLHLFGEPEAVSAVGHEDMTHGIDNILPVPLPQSGCRRHRRLASHGAYPFSMEFTVVGDNGVVEYDSVAAAGAVPCQWRVGNARIDEQTYQAEISTWRPPDAVPPGAVPARRPRGR